MRLPPERRIAWEKAYRLVPSRYPPVDLFERISDPADWETLAELEGMTNDRLREQMGDISAVPVAERISGPGASIIMAAFTHTGFPSRFSDGTYGVYYASARLEGALREVAFHQARFLSRTREPVTRVEMRSYVCAVAGRLHDVRGGGWPRIHDPDVYAAGQTLGRVLRGAGGNGIVYDSVRMPGVSNVAAFWPKVVAASVRGKPHAVEGPHFFLTWDGGRIDRYLQVGEAAVWKPLEP